MRIHIYNPETDFALAMPHEAATPYTPSAKVREMRRQLAFLPAFFADEGEALLLMDADAEHVLTTDSLAQEAHALAALKRLEIVTPDGLEAFFRRSPHARPAPWGWNHTIRRFLLQRGADAALMPDEEAIAALRRLSHRRLTIAFNERLGHALALLPQVNAAVPSEFFSSEEACGWLDAHPHAFFKAPWSSSGRGVMPADSCPPSIVRQWICGTIARQGSVMAESGARRALDCATEWYLEAGKASFLGFSVFSTSGRARYQGNITASQPELHEMILSASHLTPQQLSRVVDAQREALESLVAPSWSGFAGIDMLVEETGALRPCIEVNIRLTMGHLHIAREESLARYGTFL